MKISTLIVLLFLFSCSKLVQDEFPYFPQTPVINSILVAGNSLKLHVSLTSKIDTTLLPVVNDATVFLYVNSEYAEQLSFVEKGIYESSVIIKEGNVYNCEINIPGYETVSVCDTVPISSRILNIKHIKNAGKNEEGQTYPAVEFTFENKPYRQQYFEVLIKFFAYGEEELADIIYIEDPVILNEGIPIAVFSNELITDTVYTMKLNYTTGKDNGQQMELFPFVLELRSVSYDYYRYVKQLYLYELSRYPNGFNAYGTVFSLYSNVQNAYGIFAAYSKACSDTIVPE